MNADTNWSEKDKKKVCPHLGHLRMAAVVLAAMVIAFLGGLVGPASSSATPGQGAPASPFAEATEEEQRKDAVPGWVELSSGAKIFGRIYTTRAKRLKIFNVEKEIYEYVPVPAVREIETIVEWERMEKEWRFKEAGSAEKVYTGREYAARKFAYRLTLLGGHVITGHIVGQPLYVARPSRASGSNDEGGVERFVLHDRQKGPLDTRLEDLVYLERVVLDEEGKT
ncbi:MAG: hypothetical protein WBD63_10905 [Phycisphaerae bacterium]